MFVSPQPVRPRRRFRPIPLLLATLLAIVGLTFVPRPTEAYTWGPWTTARYYSVSATECSFATAVKNKFVGPLTPTQSGMGCRVRLRMRKAALIGWAAPWVDQKLQIENVGPWGMYGMTLTADTRYNRVKVHSNEPVCREWAFIVSVQRQVCRVENNDTARLWLRMDYAVSWTWPGVNVQGGRGASVDISNVGWIGPVVVWP